MESVSPWVAFLGGVLSLLSPCTLPMLPVYIGSLAGPEISKKASANRRLSVFFHSLSFILGFSVVFISL